MQIKRSIKRVGIFTNPTRPRAEQIRKELSQWLAKRSVQVVDFAESSIDQSLDNVDLIICLGGDGTILRLVSHVANRNIPVLGVNAGSLGFIAEVRSEELYEELDVIFSGNFEVEERMLLQASVQLKNGVKKQLYGLNDVVINREGLTRYMFVEIQIAGEIATRFPGDGVIISTPTGSTAYSLAAGGPMVHPLLQTTIITPICPHTAALRPLVVSGDQVIGIKVTCNDEREKALLSVDGQTDITIDRDTTVEVTRFKNPFHLVKSSKRTYFGTLREKFQLPG